MTVAIGLCTAVPLLAVLIVAMKDMDRVINAGMAAMELLYQATGSIRWVTCGRLAWAFARDRGTPFPDFFDNIDKRLQFPLRTNIASRVFAAIYGLIYLASTTAFNSIITSAVTLLNLSYTIPQAILITRGRAQCPKVAARSWSMEIYLQCFCAAAPVLVGLFLSILVFWGLIDDEFKGPNINWEMLNLKNEAPSDASTDIVEPSINL
ncbi:hypothetical protein N7471_007507 [Penicillium samsonianum]|uniref:uncharacterized protein n=1 Tax=Penicillium samsonianum TaxID=1882272 RepID=UPI0025475A8B|nr:uncharacterized protein N7471_007507 [Penicillium samsonianum]KAJ6132292.1 hypothetical protein N7471_007507 [Penicillium samsonianum]